MNFAETTSGDDDMTTQTDHAASPPPRDRAIIDCWNSPMQSTAAAAIDRLETVARKLDDHAARFSSSTTPRSARDDYPPLEGPTARSAQRREMCDEIDRLRAEVAEQPEYVEFTHWYVIPGVCDHHPTALCDNVGHRLVTLYAILDEPETPA